MRKPRSATCFIFPNKALWWLGSSSGGRRRAFRRSSVPALPQNAVAFKNGCGPVYLKEAVATYERNFRAYRDAEGARFPTEVKRIRESVKTVFPIHAYTSGQFEEGSSRLFTAQ